jgi:hypothetical protein
MENQKKNMESDISSGDEVNGRSDFLQISRYGILEEKVHKVRK